MNQTDALILLTHVMKYVVRSQPANLADLTDEHHMAMDIIIYCKELIRAEMALESVRNGTWTRSL